MTEAKLLPEPPLLVLPSLATALGLNEAIVLQQIHFRARLEDDGWWRATVEGLRGEFPFWSDSTVKRVLAVLRRAGLVQVRQEGTDRANRLRIDHVALSKRVRLQGGQGEPLHGVTSSSNRDGGSGQGELISLKAGKRNVNGKSGEGSARHRKYDSTTQR
jgi:DNA-binding transcriptional ArsR family regulator